VSTLDEVRRANPVTDQAAYDGAYAEATLASELAEVIYQLRTAAGLAQTELARRMGTTQPGIARVEAGGSTPTLDLLDRVGKALGVELTLSIHGHDIHFEGASRLANRVPGPLDPPSARLHSAHHEP